MQQIYLDGPYRKIKKIDEYLCSAEASERVEKIKLYKQLRYEGCQAETALKAIKLSRATFFRWQKALREKGPKGLEQGSRRPKTVRQPKWTKELQLLIFRLRKQNPIFGRLKIHKLLCRDFPHVGKVSIATVGRILKKLLELGRILSVRVLCAHRRIRQRRRVFDNHAKRWKYEMKALHPGELIQVDHMSVSLKSRAIKHFQATCPISKITVATASSTATSTVAAKFLKQMKAQLPFPIRSIQVDGGSEFMKDFEAACQADNIALYVLPPRSPKYNGCVERRNATFKHEFYFQYVGSDDMENVRAGLATYQTQYNNFRPHQALNQDTPMDYYKKTFLEKPEKSHMS